MIRIKLILNPPSVDLPLSFFALVIAFVTGVLFSADGVSWLTAASWFLALFVQLLACAVGGPR